MAHRTVVIGTGAVGLSTALALLHLGHQVTLLDRGRAGGESSWAGGGILSPLLPWGYTEPVAALALRSMAGYATWVDAVETLGALKTEFWRCGLLALNISESDQARDWCVAHEMATLDALSSSTLRRNTQENAVWLPQIAQVRNPRLITALSAAINQMGGSVREYCPATGVRIKARRVVAIQTACDDLVADQVVIATGAWAGLGLAEVKAVPQVRPIRGQMLLFKLDPGALETIVYRNGLYLIPRRDGHILVGSTLEDAGFDKSTDLPTRQRLHAEAAEILPILRSVAPIRHWAGLRPGSPDNIPIIDRHPDFDNVFVNTGHYRYGVTMAPASAELLVDLMEGKTPALDPAPYRWEAALARHWSSTL